MKNETKLNRVKEFLDGNNIKYSALFYETHHVGVHPIFIRNDETPKFVLEKVQNTIIKVMQKKQEAFEKRKKK